MHTRHPLFALLLLTLVACNVEYGSSSPTPTWPSWEPTPSSSSPDTSLSPLEIVALSPSDGAEHLPPAFQVRAEFNRAYDGLDGDLAARMGPTCDAGVHLMPKVSEDRLSATFSLFAAPGSDACFNLDALYADASQVASATAQWNIAPCGVTFDVGRGLAFEGLGSEQDLTALNAALAAYVYPQGMSFPDLTQALTFPWSGAVQLGSLASVWTTDPGEDTQDAADDTLVPSGQWTWDIHAPTVSSLACTATTPDRQGHSELQCAGETLTLSLTLSISQVTDGGASISQGTVHMLNIQAPQLVATLIESGAFNQMNDLSLSGSMPMADLNALADTLDDEAAQAILLQLSPDTDLDEDGQPDAISFILQSAPVWVPTLGCDPLLY